MRTYTEGLDASNAAVRSLAPGTIFFNTWRMLGRDRYGCAARIRLPDNQMVVVLNDDVRAITGIGPYGIQSHWLDCTRIHVPDDDTQAELLALYALDPDLFAARAGAIADQLIKERDDED